MYAYMLLIFTLAIKNTEFSSYNAMHYFADKPRNNLWISQICRCQALAHARTAPLAVDLAGVKTRLIGTDSVSVSCPTGQTMFRD